MFVIPDELGLEVGKYQRYSIQSAAGWMKRSTAKRGALSIIRGKQKMVDSIAAEYAEHS